MKPRTVMNFLSFVWGQGQPQEIALWANLIFRLSLSGTFLVSGIGKLLDLPGSQQAMGDFGVPSAFVRSSAVGLCALELAVAAGLIFDQTSFYASGVAVLLMLAMSGALARLIKQKRTPPCHCFGAVHSAPVGRSTLVRALFLAGVAGACAKLPVFALTPNLLSLAAASSGLIGASAVVRLYVLKRPKSDGKPKPLQVGQRLPAVQLRDGRWLAECLPKKERVLLIFTSANCPACKAVKAPLERWNVTFSEELPILELLSTNEEDVSGLNQIRSEDMSKFRVATPGAILVNASGVIMEPPVASLEQIEALLRVTLRKINTPPR